MIDIILSISQEEFVDGVREIRHANEKAEFSGKEDIASKAALEAKAASDAQSIAGKQASHQV